MAYLIANRIIFNHLPRTGGTWVTKTLKRCGIEVKQITIGKHEVVFKEATFTFVRNPLTWVKSVYGWKLKDLKKNKRRFIPIWHPDLNEFSRLYCKQRPGFLSQKFVEYTEPPEGSNCLIGRQEFLVEGLIQILRSFDISFSESVIRAAPRKHSSPDHGQTLSEESVKLIRESEQAAFERFYLGMDYEVPLLKTLS